jgi:large subunit ribosomal protein L2
MGIKSYKPTTSSLRFRTGLTYEELTASEPLKRLTKGKSSSGGRGAGGRVSVWQRGGGHKQKYRRIDFRRDKHGIEGVVSTLEYDPNRSAFIALVTYRDGDKRYLLAPEGLKVGSRVMSGPEAPLEPGNALPLDRIPLGMMVHNVEMHPGKGGQLVRAAGGGATLMAKEGAYVTLKMPSGEMRLVLARCYATLGVVGNQEHMNISIGKAGRNRWLGIRPHVRGVAMNPHDHPHGGGEGKTSGGRHPVTPWGIPTKGYKTRKKRKYSSKFIIKRRSK